MNVTEILQLADHLVLSQSRKHLSDLQKAVLLGVCQGEDYEEIAIKVGKSEEHIKNTAYKLWKILSKSLGENVNKFNLKSTIERLSFSIKVFNDNDFKDVNINNNFNICPDRNSEPPSTPSPQPNTTQPQKDLTTAPIINQFYGRTTELQTLENYILNSQTRLVALYGITGIGKSTLAKHFIDLHSAEFEIIIWRKLELKPPLDDFLNSILQFLNIQNNLSNTLEKNLSQLLQILAQKRCLIVIDDLQCLFNKGKLGGQYENEYLLYKTLFKTITNTAHKSCVLVITQEMSKDIAQLEKDHLSIHSFQLQGLDESAMEIFKAKGLQDEDRWLNLINLYQGNPQWLKWIADVIQELANGKLIEIFPDDSIQLSEDIEDCLTQVFSRLSDGEKQIMIALAKQEQSVTISQLKSLVSLSQEQLINGVRSLLRRCLVETIEQTEIRYNLNPLMRTYCLNLF